MLVAALVLAIAQDQDQGQQDQPITVTKAIMLPNPGNVGSPRAQLHIPEARRDTPKISPIKKFEFPFNLFGYGSPSAASKGHELRFRIYSQHKKEEGDIAPFVGRTLMRLWDYNVQRLRLDHGLKYGRLVDVYLCWGGAAGGEQRFTIDQEGDRQRRANTIHIYDLESFNEPIEMVREIAHEYGHAALPPIGGFKAPEDWANGFLGEKMYLRYLRDELLVGRLTTEDSLGASPEDLDTWVKQNVDPLVAAAAKNGPDKKLLTKTGSAAMNSYLGLVLYAESILPPAVLSRSMILTGSIKAKDYPQAILSAIAEQGTVQFRIPPSLVGKNIWLPTGKGRLGGATIKRRNAGWTLVIARSQSVRLVNR